MDLRCQYKIDLSDVGKQFGSWTQLGPSFSVKIDYKWKHRYAICACKCGQTSAVRLNALRTLANRGCFACDRVTHGLSNSPEYAVWLAMRKRCSNPRDINYRNYGGRGIAVCDRWQNSFEAFYEDMGPRPSNQHQLDRYPDNNGHYEPGNCRWATCSQNQRNKRTNRIVECNGQMVTLTDASEILGIPRDIIYARLKYGWPLEQAYTTPYARGRRSRRPAKTA